MTSAQLYASQFWQQAQCCCCQDLGTHCTLEERMTHLISAKNRLTETSAVGPQRQQHHQLVWSTVGKSAASDIPLGSCNVYGSSSSSKALLPKVDLSQRAASRKGSFTAWQLCPCILCTCNCNKSKVEAARHHSSMQDGMRWVVKQ